MSTAKSTGQLAGNLLSVGVLLIAVLAFLFPKAFSWIAPHISILLGIVMFGMGMTLTAADFKEVLRQPKQVAVGVVAQFTIMPLLGYLLAVGLNLPPEIAAGVILVGCCPGGTASNVMTYLAKGNTALSVTMTSVTTLLAPIVTPALVLLLASRWLPVSAWDMFMSVVQIILLPIALGLVFRMLFRKAVERSIRVMPYVSVVCIMAIVAAVVAVNQKNIAQSGLLIILAVVLHNVLGYLIGYGAARLFGLNYADKKAVSIEVGMQNSGLGAALAAAHFTPLAAVPSAIFSVWHNISGSLLASWWSRRAGQETASAGKDDRHAIETTPE